MITNTIMFFLHQILSAKCIKALVNLSVLINQTAKSTPKAQGYLKFTSYEKSLISLFVLDRI